MYIVAIAWLYVALMVAFTEANIVSGILSFLFYGVAPLALLLWLFGTPTRRRLGHKAIHRQAGDVDRPDTQSDQ